MPRTSRVIASGGTFVPGVPITTVRVPGGALAQMLRRGGQPAITPKPAPVQGHRPTSQRIMGPESVAPTVTQQLTGAEIASILRGGGVPVRTVAAPKPPTLRETVAGLPTRGIEEQVMTTNQIVDLLRSGGAARTPGEQVASKAAALASVKEGRLPTARNDAVSPRSQADQMAQFFAPPVVTETLTGAQLAEMGLPVTVQPTPVAPPVVVSAPVVPAPAEAKEKPFVTTLPSGGAPPVEGVPWSSQTTIPATALQSSKDPFAGFFTGA